MDNSKKFYWHIKNGKIADIKYPVKGNYMLLPYGKKLMNNLFLKLINRFKIENYNEVEFPEIIPESFTKHIKEMNLFKIKNPHGISYLAPSFEFTSSYLASLLIKDNTDTPLKIYYCGKVRRQTTKRALIKNMEFKICEFNSFFDNEKELIKEHKKINDIISKLLDDFNIPFIKVKDKLGQHKFYAFFPSLNIFGATFASVIINDRFTKYFFSDNLFKVNQLNFSFTDRMLSAYLDNHKDEKGFLIENDILPFKVAIPSMEFSKRELNNLIKILKQGNIEYIILNMKNNKFFYEWFNSSGIPLSLSIGKSQLSLRIRKKNKVVWTDYKNIKSEIIKALKINIKRKNNIKIMKLDKNIKNFEDGVIYISKNKFKSYDDLLKEIGITDEGYHAYLTKKI